MGERQFNPSRVPESLSINTVKVKAVSGQRDRSAEPHVDMPLPAARNGSAGRVSQRLQDTLLRYGQARVSSFTGRERNLVARTLSEAPKTYKPSTLRGRLTNDLKLREAEAGGPCGSLLPLWDPPQQLMLVTVFVFLWLRALALGNWGEGRLHSASLLDF